MKIRLKNEIYGLESQKRALKKKQRRRNVGKVISKQLLSLVPGRCLQ